MSRHDATQSTAAGAAARSTALTALALAALAYAPARAHADGSPTADPAASDTASGDLAARWRLALEAGSEYDTNIHRFDDSAPPELIVAAPLMRAGVRLAADWRPAPRQRLAFAGFAGGKLYASEPGQDQNVAVVNASARYEWRPQDRDAIVAARATFYDAVPYGRAMPVVEPRNSAAAGSDVVLTLLGPSDHRLSLSGGYHRFQYKPSPDYDWHGDRYGITYRGIRWRREAGNDTGAGGIPGEQTGELDNGLDADNELAGLAETASIELLASYELERRRYGGQAFDNICREDQNFGPGCLVPAEVLRLDLHHTVAAELVYTSERIYSARYELEITDSNSAGFSLVRQRLELGMTTELWARVFLTARAGLTVDLFVDPLLLARDIDTQQFTSIDDDRRSSLSVHLARDLSPVWTVEARYAIARSELATEELGFRRQVVYLGAIYRYAP